LTFRTARQLASHLCLLCNVSVKIWCFHARAETELQLSVASVCQVSSELAIVRACGTCRPPALAMAVCHVLVLPHLRHNHSIVESVQWWHRARCAVLNQQLEMLHALWLARQAVCEQDTCLCRSLPRLNQASLLVPARHAKRSGNNDGKLCITAHVGRSNSGSRMGNRDLHQPHNLYKGQRLRTRPQGSSRSQ